MLSMAQIGEEPVLLSSSAAFFYHQEEGSKGKPTCQEKGAQELQSAGTHAGHQGDQLQSLVCTSFLASQA